MKLYVGLSSSNERNECACEDWERRNKKREKRKCTKIEVVTYENGEKHERLK